MRLTKSQIEAIVAEVNDQLNNATQNQIHLFKGKGDWEKLLLLIQDLKNEEKKLEKARTEIEKLEIQCENLEDIVKEKVKKFEKKHGTDVDWEYIDEGEEPSFTLQTKDLGEKIERTIAIMTIDSKEKITADMLIERMVEKFSRV